MRDPTDLDARPVCLQAVLELLFHRPVVALFLHVDEVDDDQAGEIAQAQLPGNLLRRLQIGLQRRILN